MFCFVIIYEAELYLFLLNPVVKISCTTMCLMHQYSKSNNVIYNINQSVFSFIFNFDILKEHFVDDTFVLLLKQDFEFRTFMCNEMLSQCGFAALQHSSPLTASTSLFGHQNTNMWYDLVIDGLQVSTPLRHTAKISISGLNYFQASASQRWNAFRNDKPEPVSLVK